MGQNAPMSIDVAPNAGGNPMAVEVREEPMAVRSQQKRLEGYRLEKEKATDEHHTQDQRCKLPAWKSVETAVTDRILREQIEMSKGAVQSNVPNQPK